MMLLMPTSQAETMPILFDLLWDGKVFSTEKEAANLIFGFWGCTKETVGWCRRTIMYLKSGTAIERGPNKNYHLSDRAIEMRKFHPRITRNILVSWFPEFHKFNQWFQRQEEKKEKL